MKIDKLKQPPQVEHTDVDIHDVNITVLRNFLIIRTSVGRFDIPIDRTDNDHDKLMRDLEKVIKNHLEDTEESE